jgi:hypothetical protein
MGVARQPAPGGVARFGQDEVGHRPPPKKPAEKPAAGQSR